MGKGREALPWLASEESRVTNVRMGGKEGPGTIAGNGNVSRKLLITINHRDTRVTNSRCRGITALRVYSTLQHLLLSRGNLRNIYLCSPFRPPSLLPAAFPVRVSSFVSRPRLCRFSTTLNRLFPVSSSKSFTSLPLPFLCTPTLDHATKESRGIIDPASYVDDRIDIQDNPRKFLSSKNFR